MKRMIYADNAATTKLDMNAFEAMKPFLLDEFGNASQPYSFSRTSKKAIKEAREIIASCINAEPEEIYFTSGGTESDNWAIKGVLNPNDGGEIITSQIEHHAVLAVCSSVERLGYSVKYIVVNESGVVLPEYLENALENKSKLVSIMMVNNEIGTIEPICELAEVAHEHGVLFHTDAVQAVGHVPIDVKALGVDLLSASGHKFNAPKGIGFLYIKNGVSINALHDGGKQERSMRAGTENVASIVAMAIALKKNCEEMSHTCEKLLAIEEKFLDVLDNSKLDYVRNGAKNHVPGNISISIRGIDGETMLHRLDLKGIAISTGSACDSVNTQISHVIKAIGVPPEYAQGTLRISFGRDNTEEEAMRVAREIISITKSLLDR